MTKRATMGVRLGGWLLSLVLFTGCGARVVTAGEGGSGAGAGTATDGAGAPSVTSSSASTSSGGGARPTDCYGCANIGAWYYTDDEPPGGPVCPGAMELWLERQRCRCDGCEDACGLICDLDKTGTQPPPGPECNECRSARPCDALVEACRADDRLPPFDDR